MTSERVYVALGSNLGDRAAMLARARDGIGSLPGTRIVAASEVEETEPFGPVAQGPFLNQMLAVDTTLAPDALLDALLGLERAAGRARGGEVRWGPRTLDCDIVLFGERRLDTARLTVPHPGLADREFWRRGLRQLGIEPAPPPAARRLTGAASDDSRPAGRPCISPPGRRAPPTADRVLATSMEHRLTPTHILPIASVPALPHWAQASEKRRAHVGRVTALLARWADAMACDADEAAAMRDVGLWHDALRDAPEALLRELSGDATSPVELLHGPAVATWLARDGEGRAEVLDAVRWHTIGSAAWGRVGRALYMADFLEPGRKFASADRAFLAAHVPDDFDGVLRQVVRMRVEWSLREGLAVFPETAGLWNAVR